MLEMDTPHTISATEKARARFSENCLVCRLARKKQRGLAFWLVKHVEGWLCSFCKSYEKVHGRKSHEPVPPT
jgi:hypothetical protein